MKAFHLGRGSFIVRSTSEKTKIYVDLDGTIAEYDGNYQQGVIGEPLNDVIEILRERQGYGDEITIYTARSNEDEEALLDWTNKVDFPYDDIIFNKPQFDILVDDKVFRYDGDAAALAEQLEDVSPWWDVTPEDKLEDVTGMWGIGEQVKTYTTPSEGILTTEQKKKRIIEKEKDTNVLENDNGAPINFYRNSGRSKMRSSITFTNNTRKAGSQILIEQNVEDMLDGVVADKKQAVEVPVEDIDWVNVDKEKVDSEFTKEAEEDELPDLPNRASIKLASADLDKLKDGLRQYATLIQQRGKSPQEFATELATVSTFQGLTAFAGKWDLSDQLDEVLGQVIGAKRQAAIERQSFDKQPSSWHVDQANEDGLALLRTDNTDSVGIAAHMKREASKQAPFRFEKKAASEVEAMEWIMDNVGETREAWDNADPEDVATRSGIDFETIENAFQSLYSEFSGEGEKKAEPLKGSVADLVPGAEIKFYNARNNKHFEGVVTDLHVMKDGEEYLVQDAQGEEVIGVSVDVHGGRSWSVDLEDIEEIIPKDLPGPRASIKKKASKRKASAEDTSIEVAEIISDYSQRGVEWEDEANELIDEYIQEGGSKEELQQEFNELFEGTAGWLHEEVEWIKNKLRASKRKARNGV